MTYFTRAIIELVLLGLLSGIAGSLIVLRRRSFFAVALSHATFPGGVIFAMIGYNVLIGQALFALFLVMVMTLLTRVPGQGRQVASGVILAFGFAIGSLLAGLNPGLGVPVEALLVGSPLAIGSGDVQATAAVLVAAALLVLIFGRRILYQTFDPIGFTSAGFRSWPVELVVTAIIAGSVIVAMPAVGAILGVAVLIGPAAAAQLVTDRLSVLMPLAACFGVVGGLLGLWASRAYDLAAGGAIGLAMAMIYVLALIARRIADRVGRGARGARQSHGRGATVAGGRVSE